jgi:hypothetical protein
MAGLGSGFGLGSVFMSESALPIHTELTCGSELQGLGRHLNCVQIFPIQRHMEATRDSGKIQLKGFILTLLLTKRYLKGFIKLYIY